MSNYYGKSKWLEFKYGFTEFLNKNKWLIIIVSIAIILSLLTGIFTSVKLYNLDNSIDLEQYSMYTLIDGDIYSFRFFLLRFLSCLIMVFLLYVFSLNKFLSILGLALIIYRSFLITLNCTFIIIKLGLNGFISVFLIILPCQLLFIVLLALIFVLLTNMQKIKKECGCAESSQKQALLTLIILLLVVDIVEVILLLIFKPTTILII